MSDTESPGTHPAAAEAIAAIPTWQIAHEARTRECGRTGHYPSELILTLGLTRPGATCDCGENYWKLVPVERPPHVGSVSDV